MLYVLFISLISSKYQIKLLIYVLSAKKSGGCIVNGEGGWDCNGVCIDFTKKCNKNGSEKCWQYIDSCPVPDQDQCCPDPDYIQDCNNKGKCFL